MTNKVFLNAYLCDISIEAFRIEQQVKMLSHKKNIDRIIYYLENNSKIRLLNGHMHQS